MKLQLPERRNLAPETIKGHFLQGNRDIRTTKQLAQALIEGEQGMDDLEPKKPVQTLTDYFPENLPSTL